MRIVLLSDAIPPENVGGAGKVAWSLASGLREAGHDVHVIAATTGPSFEQVREGIPTYHLHSRYPIRLYHWLSVYNPQTVGPLRHLIQRIAPDVINAHNIHFKLSYSALSIAHQLGIPAVFTSHDLMPVAYSKLTHFIDPTRTDIPEVFNYRLPMGYNLRQMRLRYNPFRNFFIRRILTHDVVRRTCVSEAQRQALTANGLSGFTVVHNGIDPRLYNIPADLVKAARQKLQQRPTILFAGRLSREKGVVPLLDALSRVVQAVPDVLLHILAPPSSHLDRDFTSRPALKKSIQFGGWLSGQELIAMFRAVSVVALPSICLDCFPMVVLEAMAAERPVLASCFGGAREAVSDGKSGYIVNPFNTGVMADDLTRLLSDPSLADEMGQEGHRRLEKYFTLSQQVQAMETVYSEAVSAFAS